MKKNSSRHIAVFPGTFDPITKGHLDIIKRAQLIFDNVIVAVAEDPAKNTLFNSSERVDMIRREVESYKNVKVDSFGGLLIDYVEEKNAEVVVRGLRVVSDFEYEFQMALTNRKLSPTIETVFMMTEDKYAAVSSRFIKDIARLGGKVKDFVTPGVAKALKKRYLEIKKNDNKK